MIGVKHFVFLLTTFTFENLSFADQDELKCATRLIKILNSYNFSNLGILEGGYAALFTYDYERTAINRLTINYY